MDDQLKDGMRRNRHSSRAFTAFVVTWAFVVLTVTGVVLYVVPQGRIANWLQWTLFGLDKEAWSHLHMLFGLVFIAAGLIHLVFNWKPFRNYLAARAEGHLKLKAELFTSLLFSLVLAVGAVMHLPPFSSVFVWNDQLKAAWASGPDKEPPFPHAEDLALPALARRLGFDHAAAVQALRAANIRVEDERASLLVVARANGTTPAALYALLPKPPLGQTERAEAAAASTAVPASVPAPISPPTVPAKSKPQTRAPEQTRPAAMSEVVPALPDPIEIEARLTGSGLGQKTLAGFAQAEGIAVEVAIDRLRSIGLEASAEDRFKPLADKIGSKPIEIAKAVLIPGYRPQPAP